MKAAELIEEVRDLGGELAIRGDRLRYKLPACIAPEIVERLRQCKSEIIAALRQSQPELVPLRPDQPITREMLRDATDPVARGVYQLLREGEYIDERGRIRRVQ